jgi:signal transduction histidine kinase
VTEDPIARAREQFLRHNQDVVENTRKSIEDVRRKAQESYSRTYETRTRKMQEVASSLAETIATVKRQHELAKERLNQDAISRDVHVRVNRGLGALEEFVRVMRETDITEARMLEAIQDPAISGSTRDKERRASVSDLVQSVQKQLIQQTEFINIAAHELRTPIMPILLYADLLQSEHGSSEEIEAIRRNAFRLRHLADNILNVARLDSNTLALTKVSFDLNSLLAEVVNDRRPAARARLEFVPDPQPLLVFADRERVVQVVSNLLDNAMKFTPVGRITVSTRRVDGRAYATVRDEGEGISPQVFPVLFTKFGAKSLGGTGLGLYISKGIVEAHGGTITAKSNEPESRGATFEFSLPLPPVEPAAP